MDFGLNTAVKGLLASQKSLYITSHNISNTSTEGYTRQVAEQRATNPYNIPGVGLLGTGTEIYNIQRIRDTYVDYKYWNEKAPAGEWNVKTETLTEIEKLFGEPSKSSFRQYLDDFYKSLEDLSKNPSDSSYREPVRENALALTKHINETAARLISLREDTKYSIEAKVKNINSIANQIASLNKQIYSIELGGYKANDLRDKRDLLVDELSEIVNVTVDETKDGKYKVSISGISLVDHMDVNEISVNYDSNLAGGTKIDDKITITWENGSKVNLKSGELKGLLDLYNGDGINSSYRGIPYYQKRLDEFAKGFADGFNIQHRKGYILGGTEDNNPGGGSGIDFFDYDETKGVAATITLNDDIIKSVDNIAAAGTIGGSAEDNKNLLALIDQRYSTGEDENSFDFNGTKVTPDDFIKSIMSNYAVDSMHAKRMNESQELILQNIESRRNSISGVSLDEEIANMVKFQHTYTASARMISTMDEILDITINRLGLVGR